MPNDKDELEKLIASFEEKLDQKKDKNVSYSKNIYKISEIELKNHRNFLKSEIKKNFY